MIISRPAAKIELVRRLQDVKQCDLCAKMWGNCVVNWTVSREHSEPLIGDQGMADVALS